MIFVLSDIDYSYLTLGSTAAKAISARILPIIVTTAITIKNDASFSRKELTTFLESKGIETRPIMAGNFVEQPASKLIDWQKYGELTNSQLIMRNSFFIGNHHKVGETEKELVVDVFNEFFINHI